jgi:glycosidase
MKYQILILLIFCFGVTAGRNTPTLIQADPPNWWVGMKHNRVEILFSGTGISDSEVSVTKQGVTLGAVKPGESPNYLFAELNISPDAVAGPVTIEFKKKGKIISKLVYELMARTGKDFKGFNSSDVICLIVPDRFANGDASNDVIAGLKENKSDRSFDGGRHGGDIRGIINNLNYLANMGFTALWTTPMLINDMESYSYHGYAITDQYRVDPRFGSVDEYKELSQKAAAMGIKIIFDQVLNHIGTNHKWVKDPPMKDWINYLPAAGSNNYVLTNHQRTVNQDGNASQFDRDLMLHGWFVPSMADLNQRNQHLGRYLIQNSIWWIETLKLGGIRQDTYGYTDKEFLKQWTCELTEEYPGFSIVGEEWSTNPLITSYWQQGKQNEDGYESCLSTIMDFPVQSALVESLTESESAGFNRGFGRLYETMANDFVYADPFHILVMADNHDMNRIYMQLKQDKELVKMALTFLTTIRGIPQIFYGTEILMYYTGPHKVDGLIRSDFPGGWKGDTVNAFTGTGLTSDQKEVQDYLRRLLNWRKNNKVVSEGRTMHFAPFDGIYVYFRYSGDRKVMVIMNKNPDGKKINLERFREILPDGVSGTDIISGKSILLKELLDVSGKTAMVLELK